MVISLSAEEIQIFKVSGKELDATIPLSALHLWEENMRKSFISASVQDSSLTALQNCWECVLWLMV